MNLWPFPFRFLSPAGTNAALSVLIFHRVLPAPDPIFPGEITAVQFDQIISWLKLAFNILPLDEAMQRLQSASLPARAAALTFDDGYEDNYSQALPILQRHGVTSTFFVASGYLNGGVMWNDIIIESIRRTSLDVLDLSSLGLGIFNLSGAEQRRIAIETLIGATKYRVWAERQQIVESIAELAGGMIPLDLMMSSEQVLGLRRAGMLIGAHTVSHPILARLPEAEVRQEIADGRDFLEGVIKERVRLFAYPNGKPGEDYRPVDVSTVRQLGFDAAMSTAWGAARRGTDVFQVPRFSPWDRTQLRFLLRMAANLR